MPTDEALTLALVLTAGGAVGAAALVTGLIQLLKSLPGTLLVGRERLAAFVLSAVLVVLAAADRISVGAMTLTLASGFALFLAWYGIARLAMAVYDDLTQRVGSLTGQSPRAAAVEVTEKVAAAYKAAAEDAAEHAAVLATFQHEKAAETT